MDETKEKQSIELLPIGKRETRTEPGVIALVDRPSQTRRQVDNRVA